VLKKYVMDTSEANFFILPDGSYDPFWEAIRNRCKKVYEEDPSLTRTSGWGTYLFHMALLLVVQPLIFYYGYLQKWALWSHLSAFAMGIVVWIGGRLGHDAGHYAVCPKKYYSGWFTAICSGFALTNIG
jgi:fatty acid desaturase